MASSFASDQIHRGVPRAGFTTRSAMGWVAGHKPLVPAWSRADAEVEEHDAHNDGEVSSEYQHHHNGSALGGGVVGRSPESAIVLSATSSSSSRYSISLNLLIIPSGVGIVGRIVPNFIADCIGAVNVFMRTSIIASVLVYCFIAIDRPVGLYDCVLVFGIVGAGIQSLFPAVLSFLTTDLRKLGVSMGMAFAIVSLVMLTGPPIAGPILASPARYTSAKVFAASPIAAECDFSIAAKAARLPSKGLDSTSRI
ncbi:hypothetical protein MY10362_009222 [Beauveria mimosiformis]